MANDLHIQATVDKEAIATIALAMQDRGIRSIAALLREIINDTAQELVERGAQGIENSELADEILENIGFITQTSKERGMPAFLKNLAYQSGDDLINKRTGRPKFGGRPASIKGVYNPIPGGPLETGAQPTEEMFTMAKAALKSGRVKVPEAYKRMLDTLDLEALSQLTEEDISKLNLVDEEDNAAELKRQALRSMIHQVAPSDTPDDRIVEDDKPQEGGD